MPIDTRVDADAASCRAVAAWLTGLSGAAHDSSESTRAAAGASAGAWRGEAADAFRDRAGQVAGSGEAIADAAGDGASALSAFADEVEAVTTAMARARDIAAAAGIPVVDGVIADPVGPPPPTPVNPQTALAPVSDLLDRQAALDAANAQRAAFDQAAAVAADARRRYVDAGRQLESALAPPGDVLQSPQFTWSFRGLVAPTITAGSFFGAADKWQREADRLGRRVGALDTAITDPARATGPAAEQRYQQLLDQQTRAQAISDSNSRMTAGLDKNPGASKVLAWTARAPDFDSAPGLLARAAPVAKNVPYLSWAATSVGIGLDMEGGRSAADATTKNLTQTAVSTGLSVGVTAGLTALAVAGGPATLVGVGLGFAASWAIGENWDTLTDWTS